MKFNIIGICRALVTIAILCISVPSWSQINQQNFSTVKVDELSDDQIKQFMSQVEESGLSQAQLEQVALARGMAPGEIQKLKERVDKLNQGNEQRTATGTTTTPQQLPRAYNPPVGSGSAAPGPRDSTTIRSRIFGAELFGKRTNLSFEPNLRLATPANYQVGPDDQLLIDIYGNSEVSYKLVVSPEGTINVPRVGVIPVGGMTIEQATVRIKSRLATIYTALLSGQTSVSITLGNIRSIKVILSGEVVMPGTYTLPSVATAFNALYQSGGPTQNGSFRKIEVLRAGRRIATLDVYDFLLNGAFRNNVRLQDQDVIRVPTYQIRTEISGQVKRPGIFEMLPGEKLVDLLRFSGDFTERAYKATIKVIKNTDKDRKINTITADEVASYQPSTGDLYFVDEILNRFQNRVSIGGAVFRPGQYELTPGLTLKQLIGTAEGITENAFLPRGYITRLKPDNTVELISFDLGGIIKGTTADISLQREDQISISSIFDLRDEYKVSINGDVRTPGTIDYAENMSLEDLIIKAGGFREGASPNRVEVSRRVTNSDSTSVSASTAQVFQINIDKNLKLQGPAFVLQPFDIVSVRSSTGYEVQRQVFINGEVLYPGVYTLKRKDERISDLLNRAGGLTALAYPAGASLKRPGPLDRSSEEELEKLERFRRLQRNVNDSLARTNADISRSLNVGINLDKIILKPGSAFDLLLEEGDILRVPKQLQTVRINGEVLSPITVIYKANKSFRQYISESGGFTERALKRRSYLVNANGSVKSTKKFFFFNNYPSVKPGAEIFVPKRGLKVKLLPQEILGIASGIASFAAIMFGILNLSRN